MNPTPEAAHGWLDFFNRLGKTKFGAGVIGFAVAVAIAVAIYYFIVNDNLIELRNRVDKKNIEIANHSKEMKEAIAEEKRNCLQTYREYYQLFSEQQEAMDRAEKNQQEMEDMRKMMEQILKDQ